MIPCYLSCPRPLFLRRDRRTTILCADLYSQGARGSRGGVDGWGTALQSGMSRVRFPMVSLEFFIEIFLPAALWLWDRLNLSHKWTPGICLWCKGVLSIRLTTLPSCANCLEILEPEPPGTLSACSGLFGDSFLARCQYVGELKKAIPSTYSKMR
jgi:hypothetical protein